MPFIFYSYFYQHVHVSDEEFCVIFLYDRLMLSEVIAFYITYVLLVYVFVMDVKS